MARFIALGAALAGVALLLPLPGPARTMTPAATRPLVVQPPRVGPAPVRLAARLADGTRYEPRAYLSTATSVGLAPSRDGSWQRLVLVRTGSQLVELRRVATADRPAFDGFTVAGDTLVWAQTISPYGGVGQTTLWRTNWRRATTPVLVTSNTGEASFFGGQNDLVVNDGRVSWVAEGRGATQVTEVRSVALTGGPVTVARHTGHFALSTWPWLAGVSGGGGRPVELVNLVTKARQQVVTQPQEVVVCDPMWCRISVLDGTSLVRLDLQRPDGSGRRHVAGPEATPTIVDVSLMDRYIPLKTDQGGDSPKAGLSLYDIDTAGTNLVASSVTNVQARGAFLWWSTGSVDELTWHVIDLRELPGAS